MKVITYKIYYKGSFDNIVAKQEVSKKNIDATKATLSDELAAVKAHNDKQYESVTAEELQNSTVCLKIKHLISE